MTQEFHLSITPLGSDRYLIRTEDTATGVPVAEAQVLWPVDEWLQLAQPAMADPVLELLQGKADLNQRSPRLADLGKQLYDALFQETSIRESWLRAQGIAQNRHEILRFRLGLKESRLQRLPWELLRQEGQPLTTRADLTFTRYAANHLMGQTAEVESSVEADDLIQVLFVIASPSDQDHLKLLQEVRHIQEILGTEQGTHLPIQIQVLEQPDRNRLAQELEQRRYQILHYAGHSDFGQNGGDLSLVNRQTGLTERLSGDDLAGLLVNNRVALTVFNSCRSGHTAGDDAEMDWRQQNLVQALVSRGVPSVIAMAERIPDDVAIAFTQRFYNNLRKGYPIDLSLNRTREGLSASFGSDQHYWALPILYLQPDFDGYLTKRDREADDQLDPDALEMPEIAPLETPEMPASTDASPEIETVSDPLPTAEGVTTTLITQLESPLALDSDEVEVANFVKQLSSPSPLTEEPLPADRAEVLITDTSDRAGMQIYDTLPEVPLPPTSANGTAPSSGTHSAVDSAQEQPQPPTAQQRFSPPKSPPGAEKSLLVWFALGLIGVVGVIGLGFLAFRSAERVEGPILPTAPSDATVSSDAIDRLDAGILIEQAQQAIAAERYTDARNYLELALTQELQGNTEGNTITEQINTLLLNTQVPELLYIKGRIRWQAILQLTEDDSIDARLQRGELAAAALEFWRQTDETFLKGRVARGFAYYTLGQVEQAIEEWETAETLYERQRPQQPDPTSLPTSTVSTNSVILHAYAGLAMAYMQYAQDTLTTVETLDLEGAAAEEKALLRNEAENARAIALNYVQQIADLADLEQMSPASLQMVNAAPETWDHWLWTDPLLAEWARVYEMWDEELPEAP